MNFLEIDDFNLGNGNAENNSLSQAETKPNTINEGIFFIFFRFFENLIVFKFKTAIFSFWLFQLINLLKSLILQYIN